MMRRLAPRRGDDGAVALIVAVLVVAFFTIAASTIDFGQAYVTKRQLSTSADAAALAAAQYYAGLPGTCTTLSGANDPADLATAQSIAKAYVAKNFPGASYGTLTAQCSPNGKQLWVQVGNSATDAATFGQFAGINSITTSRSATANVYVAASIGGALPYALCFSDAQAIADNPDTVERAVYPSACGNFPGNWYSMDCPEDSGNTNSNNLAKFCTDQVTTIDATDDGVYPKGDNKLSELYVVTQCNALTGWSSDCLRGNSGQLGQANIVNFWDSLLGATVVFPVVYDNTITGTGSQTYFPIVGFLAAEVCGFHWGGTPQQGQVTTPTTDKCVADNTNNYSVTQLKNSDNYLLLVQAHYTYGGSSPSGCGLGDSSCADGAESYGLIR